MPQKSAQIVAEMLLTYIFLGTTNKVRLVPLYGTEGRCLCSEYLLSAAISKKNKPDG